jgi:hypothetical protein
VELLQNLLHILLLVEEALDNLSNPSPNISKKLIALPKICLRGQGHKRMTSHMFCGVVVATLPADLLIALYVANSAAPTADCMALPLCE